ncbi:MAG: MFS transporter [Candidatus Dojkabacteria bacterium]|jgi:MFS family permease|nr:MFS transporter [Candidatus Dojkabacteria bacterium]
MLREIVKKLTGFNRIVIYLSLSDVFSWGAFTVISILSGIYLSDKLGVDTLKFLGIGTSIYFFTRAAFQIPIGLITDKYKKDRDEILILFVGVLLMGLPYIFYPYIETPLQYFILQFIFGLGVSLNVTNWRKLFALNIDGGKEGIQYGIYDLIMSVSAGLLSIVAGTIANMGDLYFDTVISLAGVLIMLGSVWVILIYKYEDRKSKKLK